MCSIGARIAERLPLARAELIGIGWPRGFLRWMWLSSIRSLSSASFFLLR